MLAYMNTIDTLIMHNGVAYDLPLLKKLYGFNFKGRVIDTVLMSRLQRPNRKDGNSLEAWGKRLGFHKQEHEDWSQFSDDMLKRCETDVALNVKVYEALLKEQGKENWEQVHKVVSKLFSNLEKQREYGWHVDQDHLHRSLSLLAHWKRKIHNVLVPHLPYKVEVLEVKRKGEYGYVKKPFTRAGKLVVSVARYCGDASISIDTVAGCFTRVRFRPLSLDKPQELKEHLLDLGWQPLEWNMKDGQRTSPKLSKEDTFEGVAGGIGKMVVKYASIKQREGILNGWQEAVRNDSRVPSIISGLTVTSRARHRVIANVPRITSFFGKQMRMVFSSSPNYVLVGADVKGCQLRMLAGRMQDAEFQRQVLQGDIHAFNMQAAGIDDRDKAKTFIYAFIFGASDRKISSILKCTPERASKIRKQFLTNLPKLDKLIKSETARWRTTATRTVKWNRLAYQDGYVYGIDGRRIYVDSEHKVLMGLLQSDEAILMQYAYNIFHNKMEKDGYEYGSDWGMCSWYHDEFQVECKEHLGHVVGSSLCASVEAASKFLKLSCPHEGEYKIGKSWADTH